MSDIVIFGISLPLLVAEFGIVVTAFSAAVGIWIERDRSRPIGKPVALTIFVFFAGALTMYQCWSNNEESDELQADLAKILEQLDQVAVKSEVELPDLNDTLKQEMMIHGRSNPKVLMDMAKRIAAKGGDPQKVLAAYLPEADLQAMKRDGKFDEALADPKVATMDVKRPKLAFGDAPPRLRDDAPEVADAGVEDAAVAINEPADSGVLDAGVAEAGVVTAAVANIGTDTEFGTATRERESLKRQIDEARSSLAEAKTWPEKRERQKKLFDLLGAIDKLEKAMPALTATAAAPPPSATTTPPPPTSATASTKTKKPKIEIEEDDTP